MMFHYSSGSCSLFFPGALRCIWCRKNCIHKQMPAVTNSITWNNRRSLELDCMYVYNKTNLWQYTEQYWQCANNRTWWFAEQKMKMNMQILLMMHRMGEHWWKRRTDNENAHADLVNAQDGGALMKAQNREWKCTCISCWCTGWEHWWTVSAKQNMKCTCISCWCTGWGNIDERAEQKMKMHMQILLMRRMVEHWWERRTDNENAYADLGNAQDAGTSMKEQNRKWTPTCRSC